MSEVCSERGPRPATAAPLSPVGVDRGHLSVTMQQERGQELQAILRGPMSI
jgi:hypothetical protein